MPTAPRQPSAPDGDAPGGPPPRSRLAVAALVLALVPCCPAVPLAGSMLGVLAHARIRRAGGRLGGEGIAIGAMVAGSVLAVVQMLLLERYLQTQSAEQARTAIEAVEASLDDDRDGWPTSALPFWADGAAMDAERLRAGVAELEAALGPFRDLRVSDVRPAGPGLALGRVWSGIISAGPVDRPAAVEAVVAQTPRAGAFGILPRTEVRLRAIRIVLPDSSDLVIGTPLERDDPADGAAAEADGTGEPDASAPSGDARSPDDARD